VDRQAVFRSINQKSVPLLPALKSQAHRCQAPSEESDFAVVDQGRWPAFRGIDALVAACSSFFTAAGR
jgi:hypothetical protein